VRSGGPGATAVTAHCGLTLGYGDLLIWVVIALVWLSDVVLAWAVDFSFRRLDIFALPFVILLPSVLFYAWRGAVRPFDLTHCLARYYALGIGATILSYLAALTPMPLADPLLARVDAALGFDWVAWNSVVTASPWLHATFAFAYESMQVQIILCLLGFPLLGQRRRADEMVWAFALSIVPTLALSAILPAETAWGYFGYAASEPPKTLLQFLALRAGGLRALAPPDLGGIVAFPSYHAVWAILTPWLLRGTMIFLPALLLNAAMLAASISEGGHYLVDIVGGATVAGATIAAIRLVPILTRPAGNQVDNV
jgi:hypothetical protein